MRETGGIHTFDRLGRKEIMPHSLEAYPFWNVLNSVRQVLQNHSAFQVGIPSFQILNLAPAGSAHVDEENRVVIVVGVVDSRERVLGVIVIQPVAVPFVLRDHEFVERVHQARLLRHPRIHELVRLVRLVEGGFHGHRGICKVVSGEDRGEVDP